MRGCSSPWPWESACWGSRQRRLEIRHPAHAPSGSTPSDSRCSSATPAPPATTGSSTILSGLSSAACTGLLSRRSHSSRTWETACATGSSASASAGAPGCSRSGPTSASSGAPAGATCDRTRNPLVASDTIVLRSGPPTGVWQEDEIDPAALFRAHFEGGNPAAEVPELQGVGILTDGDQTHTMSAADYAGFVLYKRVATASH